jgi:plasmid stabilization system protein ParE
MTALRLTCKAEEDIGTILGQMARSIRFFGEEAAERYCEALKAELERLAASPWDGQPEPQVDGRTLSHGFRRHIIYYEPGSDGILVLRLLPRGDAGGL